MSLLTGEAVLPLYSEYQMQSLIDDKEFERLVRNGDIPFILTTRHMLYMDFDLYVRMRTATDPVTYVSGLPDEGEYELLRVRKK